MKDEIYKRAVDIKAKLEKTSDVRNQLVSTITTEINRYKAVFGDDRLIAEITASIDRVLNKNKEQLNREFDSL
jgi:hypothetical protein